MPNSYKKRLLEVCSSEGQRSYGRKRILVYQGEVPKSVYIIRKGVVRSYNISANGEERTIELLSEGDILPSSWVFNATNVSSYYYDAFIPVQLHVMTKDDFLSLISRENLESDITKRLAQRYTAATIHINALLQTHAQDKIIQALLYLGMSHGKRLRDGKLQLDIRLTQQDIAGLVGITRETAAMELNKLKDKGLISYKSFTYTIDSDALVRLRGDNEFKGVSL